MTPFVCHLPLDTSLTDFFSEAQLGPGQPGHGVIDVPGGFVCTIGGESYSCSRPVPRGVSVVHVRPAGIAASSPAQVPADTGGTVGVNLALLEADRAAAALGGSRLHTCFDVLIGPRFRGRFEHWGLAECVRDCEVTSRHIPEAVGHILVHEVEGLPSPQTVVTAQALLPTHRCFVFDLRAIGMHVVAVSAPNDVPVHETLRLLDADTWQTLRGIFASQLGFRFFVNGVLTVPALPLPTETDVVSIFPPAVAGLSAACADMAAAIWDDAHDVPPTTTSTTCTPAPVDPLPPPSVDDASGPGSNTGPVFLDVEDDGLVPASSWWRLKGHGRQQIGERIWLARLAGMSPSPFTLFDEAGGAHILQRQPHWSRRQCVIYAIGVARTPAGVGRLIDFPVPGWPEPQVVVSNPDLWRTHRSFVLLTGAGDAPVVVQAPLGASMKRAQILTGRFPPLACCLHDEAFDCDEPLPPDTDYVRVHESDTIELEANFPGLDSIERVPREHFLQPAYRSHFLARGFVRGHGFPTGVAGRSFVAPVLPLVDQPTSSDASSSISDDSASCSGGPVEHELQFTVFDVHFHVRVMVAAAPASTAAILHTVLMQMPQLRNPIGYRVLREPLAGFPSPQVVVWQGPSEGERTLPVLHSEVVGAICTVSVPTSCSAYQLAYIIEEACNTPVVCRTAIARQEAHFTFDGGSYPPFSTCDFGSVDSAVYARGPFTRSRLSAARWTQHLPRALSTVAPWQITH